MRKHKEELTTEEMIKRHESEGGFDRVDRRAFKHVDYASALIRGTFREAIRIGVVLNEVKGNILEIGCSSGVYSIYFAQFGHKCTGIDFVQGQIDMAQKYAKSKNVNVLFELGDAHKLKYADNTYDTVFLGEIIEHVLNPEQIIKEALRVLKPEGKIIITFPDKFGIYIDGVSKTTHINQPTEQDIKDICPIKLKKLKCLHSIVLTGTK